MYIKIFYVLPILTISQKIFYSTIILNIFVKKYYQ